MPCRAALVGSALILIALALAEASNPKAGSQPACGEVKLWDVAEHRCRLTLQTDTAVTSARGCTCVAISPDGKQVAAGTFDGMVWLWDAATGAVIRHTQTEAVPELQTPSPVIALRFSADGKSINFLDAHALRRWEWQADRLVVVHQHPKGKQAIRAGYEAFDAAGRQVMYPRVEPPPRAGTEYVLDFRDAATGKIERSLPLLDLPTHVARSADGANLAYAERHRAIRHNKDVELGTVRLIDPASGKEGTITDGYGPIAFSPDGKTLVFLREKSGGLVFWNFPGADRREVPSEFISTMAVSPDGKFLATSEGPEFVQRTIKLRDGRTGAVQAERTGHEGRITGLTFSADGRTLASAGGRAMGPAQRRVRSDYPNDPDPDNPGPIWPARGWTTIQWLTAILAGFVLLIILGGSLFLWRARGGR